MGQELGAIRNIGDAIMPEFTQGNPKTAHRETFLEMMKITLRTCRK